MSRLKKIPKNQDLISSIKLATFEFKNEHNVSDLYFANKLHFQGANAVSQYTNLLQSFNDKYIKVDELLLLLDTLGSHSKIVIDFLSNKYGFVCSQKATNDKQDTKYENIKDLLLNISASHGNVVNEFITANVDLIIDKEECDSLLEKSYQVRALLNQFEFDLKEKSKNL